jgi:WD40 repeat protein
VAGIPGKQAAVSSAYDGAVAWVDLAADTIELLGYHEHLVNRICVNASGTLAASASSDYSVILWDLVKREKSRTLLGHSDDVEDFAFIDDHRGISVSRDWRVLLWNLDTGAVERVFDGHQMDVLSVTYHDGKVYTSGDDMTLRVWDVESGRALRVWGPFETETDTCAIDPSRSRTILGCDDGVIRIFDIESGKTVAEIPAHKSGIKKVAVNPVNGDILSAAYDQRILVWHADDLTLKLELESRPATWERSFNWATDGKTVMAGTFDGSVLVWDAIGGKLIKEIGNDGKGNACFNEVSVDGNDLATVSDDGRIRLGRLSQDESRWVHETEPTDGRILANAVTMDRSLSLVASGAHNQKLHLFNWNGDSLDGEIVTHLGEGPINCVRVSHHPEYKGDLFAACYSGAVVRINRKGEIQGRFQAHENAVKALRLHPTDAVGVSCSADGGLATWSFEGERLCEFPGHMAIVDDVDFDPTGKRIASVSRDFTVKIYETSSGLLVGSYSLGKKSPKGVLFFDEDTVIITNYWGSLFRLDLTDGTVTDALIAQNGISSAARVDESTLVASSYDGALYLVDAKSLKVLNTLRAMTQRVEPSLAFA